LCSLDIDDARVWSGLAVDLAVEEPGCADLGEHAGVGAAHAHVVARTHLVAHRAPQLQVRLLHVPAENRLNHGVRSPKFIWAPCHVLCTATAVLIG
jgi:hypothetical protein